MACSRRHCSKAFGHTIFTCQCGASFCSEACFIATWHAGHKAECPRAADVISEMSRAASDHAPSSRRRVSQTALLCDAALTRQKCTPPPTGGFDPHEASSSEPLQQRNKDTHVECLSEADRSTISTQSTVTGSSPHMSFAGSTATEANAETVVPERIAPASCSLSDFAGSAASIGSGAFGTVKKVTHKKTNDVFAMKSIPKRKIVDNNMTQHLLREVRTQLLVDHPHIIRLFHYFEDSESIHLLLEFATDGSLFKHFQRRGRLPDVEAVEIFAGVASALDYLHTRNIIHRDVKPENILLCEGGVAKLADFGWCAELAANQNRQTFCGTWDYLSPEMISGEAHDHAVDIWAMGVLLYEMLVGRPPFTGQNNAASLQRIQAVDLQVPAEVSASAQDLISRLLVRRPGHRIPLTEALDHEWLKRQTRHPEPPQKLEWQRVPAPPQEAASPTREAAPVEDQQRVANLQWPWKEKLHSLELVDDEDEEDDLIPPMSQPKNIPSSGTLPTTERRRTPWKDTNAYVAVNAFVKDDTLSKTAHAPRRRAAEDVESLSDKAARVLSHVEEIDDGLSASRRLDSTLRAVPKDFFEMTSRPLAPIDEAAQSVHADDMGSRQLDVVQAHSRQSTGFAILPRLSTNSAEWRRGHARRPVGRLADVVF